MFGCTSSRSESLQEPARDPEEVAALGVLFNNEIYWREHYDWLLSQGYRLRPRLKPDWMPSWVGTNMNPYLCEDVIPSAVPGPFALEYATSPKTGKMFILKKTDPTEFPEEVQIARLLSKEPLKSDPNNHSIPLVEVLEPPDSECVQILVFPLLRYIVTPPFETKGEALHFMNELLTGLAFLHSHRIIHGDIHIRNILMDATDMYPKGFCPIRPYARPEWTGPLTLEDFVVPRGSRTELPPKYYLSGFQMSRMYEEDQPHHVWGVGSDRTVPEFQDNLHPIDAFAVDVYCVGNLIKSEFVDGYPPGVEAGWYRGFNFLRPLVTSMTQDDPMKRPTMLDAMITLRHLIKGLSHLTLRSPCPLVSSLETRSLSAWLENMSLSHWWKQLGYIRRKLPPIPSRRTVTTDGEAQKDDVPLPGPAPMPCWATPHSTQSDR